MHKFIMKHPQIKDICDFGYYAFGKSKIAYEFTAVMLLLNNIMLIGFVRTIEPASFEVCLGLTTF